MKEDVRSEPVRWSDECIKNGAEPRKTREEHHESVGKVHVDCL